MISVVIFAAGLGSRLGASVPKFVVEVDSQPVFVHQLRALRELDAEIYVICGYRAALLVQLMLEDLSVEEELRKRLTFVYNDDYRNPQSGSIRRALAVIPHSRPALFIDGDMLFHRDTVNGLAQCSVTTAVVRDDVTADGVMAEITVDGHLVKFARGGRGKSEWGNIVIYQPSDLLSLHSIVLTQPDCHHFELINSLVQGGRPVRLRSFDLAEIDDVSDLPAATIFARGAH